MWEKHLEGRKVGILQGRGGCDPDKPTVLMLHGSGGRAEYYLSQLRGLPDTMNRAAIDLPGCGKTPGPASDEVADYARWLGDFLAAGPVKPILMGHSLGGAVAQQLALTRPELLQGLILLGTGCRLRVFPAILEGIVENYQPTVEMIVRYCYAEGASKRTLAQGVEMINATDPMVLLSHFTACDNFNVCERLAEIKLPTLVLVGDQDNLTPVKYSRFLAEHIAGAELKVIEGGGHMVNIEQADKVNQAIADFVQGLA